MGQENEKEKVGSRRIKLNDEQLQIKALKRHFQSPSQQI
jgi:hypothetical protein